MSKAKKTVPTVEPVVDIPIETTPDSIIATPVVDGYVEPNKPILPEVEIPVVAETVNELSSDKVTPESQPESQPESATVEPQFSEPQPSVPIEIKIEPAVEVAKRDTLEVDKYLFYRMMKSCVNAKGYGGHAAVSRFGEMLGAKTYAEQKAEWHKAQEYLAKEGK
jgi:hypothetical protein